MTFSKVASCRLLQCTSYIECRTFFWQLCLRYKLNQFRNAFTFLKRTFWRTFHHKCIIWLHSSCFPRVYSSLSRDESKTTRLRAPIFQTIEFMSVIYWRNIHLFYKLNKRRQKFHRMRATKNVEWISLSCKRCICWHDIPALFKRHLNCSSW